LKLRLQDHSCDGSFVCINATNPKVFINFVRAVTGLHDNATTHRLRNVLFWEMGLISINSLMFSLRVKTSRESHQTHGVNVKSEETEWGVKKMLD